MKRLFKNTKGAVTVFITLLLIPAVLVSGTAVDLTRIYTARSIIQDANQLAANSVLSQYNALLQDIYGLFGVAKNDPILAELFDEYIKVTVFGEESKDTSMGTLQLFYGSNLTLEEVYFPEDKNLRNANVLRRQIEEYMKFRGPVIIVTEFLELIGSNSFKEDTGVIEDKLEIDDGVAELYEKYKELYDAIQAADRCTLVPSDPAGAAGDVSRSLTNIRDEFVKLGDCFETWKKCREDWEKMTDPVRKDRLKSVMDDLEKQYKAILANIVSRTEGGTVGSNWSNGKWKSTGTVQGLQKTIENALNRADRFKPVFDEVVKIAAEVDAMRDELSRKVDELERRLESGECNEELKAALTARGASGKSVIEIYRDILKWDNVEGMATVYKDGGYKYIDEPLKEMLQNVIYRNKNNTSDPRLTQKELSAAVTLARLALSKSNRTVPALAGYSAVGYEMPAGFVKFGGYPGDNKAFYKELSEMMNAPAMSPVGLFDGQEESGSGDAEDKQRNMIDELLGLVDSAYAGMTNSPLGAKYINSAADGEKGKDSTGITESVSEASTHPAADVLTDPYGSIAKAGDYLLLLTYCTSMFSNYTTARPEINGKSADDTGSISFPKSASGVPLSPKVNYFFQSEWEYLYNGNENAGSNLSAVSRLIYLIRVICNYITVFSVSEVTMIVNSVRTAFSWCPPLGLVLGELARAAFVAAESAVDLATLRAGYKVPLIKSGKNGQWVCSPSGLVNALTDVLEDTARGDGDESGAADKGISYSGYMIFFFLAKGLISSNMAEELTGRTADLIEWNMINYKGSVLCNEEKMTEALSAAGRFKMEDMKTDLTITTTADLRMMFLSMAFFRSFADSRGLVISQTIPVTVTDYRGY